MVGFHAGHKPWPYDPSVHHEYHTDEYTFQHADVQLWARPVGSSRYTSMDQSSAELRHQWDPYSGEKGMDEYQSIRRGYLVNARRFDEAFGSLLSTVKSMNPC